MYKIMLVEDDAIIAQSVAQLLRSWQYEIVVVEQFDQVVTQFLAEKPQLLLLDITLPLFNGYYWCQEIRKLSNVPILFLSSHDQASDIVLSLNLGADDYITKPFDTMVLLAKVQSLLRRSYELTAEQEWLSYHELLLNLKTTLLHYHEQQIDLTKNEFQILRCLLERGGKVISREQLMQQLWHSDVFIDDNTLSVNVARLRKKLSDANLPPFIQTKKGIGYYLTNNHSEEV